MMGWAMWLAGAADAVEPIELALLWSASPEVGSGDDGLAVSSAGDVNGDGFDDLVIGARNAEDGDTLEGLAYVYYGSATGPALAPSWTADVDQASAWFGAAVASAGDVNNDGYDDVIVGSPMQDGVFTDSGLAHVFLGSATGLATVPIWSMGVQQVAAAFGVSVASAGDVDNDGYDDVIIGADTFDGGSQSEGTAVVFHGGQGGVALIAEWSFQGNEPMAFLGASVGSAGDINADTYGDVIVGAPGHSAGQNGEGSATLFIGSPNGVDYDVWGADSNQAMAGLGGLVGSAGDVNGDGLGDVLVAASGFDNPEVDEGRVFVYHGSQWGIAGEPAWSAEGGQDGAAFGASAASAGDVNDDGYDDLVVGAGGYDGARGEDEGRVFVYLGGGDGLGDTRVELSSDAAGSRFGDVVASAGDVNGDGYDDVIVGAPQYGGGSGRTYVFSGAGPDADGDGDGSSRPYDCDDGDATVYPGAPELCDGQDNACAGGIPDEDADLDHDGTATCAGDCDDDDAGIHPGAEEVCDGADLDCDGETCDDGIGDACTDEACDEGGCTCDGSGAAAGLPAMFVALLALRRRRYRTSAA